MTVPLPDEVVEALNELSLALTKHNLKLSTINIERRKTPPHVSTYLLNTPGGVVHIKQEL